MTSAEVRALLDDIFEEEALVLGGLLEIHGASGVLVRQLFGSLQTIRAHALERLEGVVGPPPARPAADGGSARPAIEEFLSLLGRR